MAEHVVPARAIGAHSRQLEAEVVDTVTFADDLRVVEVVSDGAAELYFTVDGGMPEVGDPFAHYMPAVPSSRTIGSGRGGATVVKLISPGTPTYSVAKGKYG
jgi:hypothetical protein